MKFVEQGLGLFLGAGASCDYGFPSGSKLMSELGMHLADPEGNWLGDYLLNYSGFTKQSLVGLGQRIHECIEAQQYASIDAFIDQERKSKPEYLEIARMAVWCTILSYERVCNLEPEEQDWMQYLFDHYLRKARDPRHARWTISPPMNSPDEGRVGLAVYTLNYDRLFEWKLINYLKVRFPSDPVEPHIETICKDITHSHGSLGPLHGDGLIAFGAELPKDAKSLKENSDQLKFWFELSSHPRTWNKSLLFSFRTTLLILGYGFHPCINSRFEPNRRSDAVLDNIYSSCYGISDSERESISAWIRDRFQIADDRVCLAASDATCKNLIEQACNS